jgi:hypothetical protein
VYPLRSPRDIARAIQSFFSTILLPDSALALLHRDGSLLAGYLQFDEATAKRFFDSPLLAQGTQNNSEMPTLCPSGLIASPARLHQDFVNAPVAVAKNILDFVAIIGAQGRDRTTDTAIFSRMLYQLSYLGMSRRGAGSAGL